MGLIDYFLPDYLPGILSKFSKQHPNIHLEVRTDVGINLVPLYEKGELDLVVVGSGSFEGKSRILTREPLVWVTGTDSEAPLQDPLPLALLPAPCSFRQLATDGLEAVGRKWEILFTGTSISNIQAAVQAGIGLSILPVGALKKGLKKAPTHLGLPELPMYSIAIIADEQQENQARDVFTSYLESALSHLD